MDLFRSNEFNLCYFFKSSKISIEGRQRRPDIAKDQMAKGQKRSSKEARKPKQPVAKPPEPSRGVAVGGAFRKP
jgi:hypothetical protein